MGSPQACAAEERVLSERHLKAPEESVRRDFKYWNEGYSEALKVFAERCGVSPEQFQKGVRDRISENHATPQCLTLGEIDTWADGLAADSRREHVKNCEFCTRVIEAMNVHSPGGEASFVEAALQTLASGRFNLRGKKIIAIALVSAGLAGAMAIYVVRGWWPAQTASARSHQSVVLPPQ